MAISTQIQWLADGERANALVLNRPLKKALELIEQKFTELEQNVGGGGGGGDPTSGSGFPKAVGYVFAEAKIEGSVQDLDFVYINPNGNKVEKTPKADSKFIGVYNKVAKKDGGHEHRVITSGCVTMTGKNLQVGKDYYLSSTPGGIDVNGTIYVGTCIDNNILSIGSRASLPAAGGGGGTANLKEVPLTANTKQYSVSYTPNKTMFFVEGVLLNSNMITATDGQNVTLAFNPKSNDVLSVVSL